MSVAMLQAPTTLRQPTPVTNPVRPSSAPRATPPIAPSTFQGDQLNLSTRAGFGLSNMQMISLPVGPLNDTPQLSADLNQLRHSGSFRNVYRNFDLVPAPTQEAILKKLQLIQSKYPDFLQRLEKVDNPKYGNGFQFFFVPEEKHDRWAAIPSGVRGTGGTTDYIGIVYSSPAISVLKNDHSPIKKALHYISQGAMEAMQYIRPQQAALDVGGMFTDISEDTYTHEMGHVLHGYMMSNQDQLEIWSIYAEAERTGQGFITDYARTNHMEFFAEAVEAYLHQDSQGHFTSRESLQKTNPHLYRFTERMLEPGVHSQGQDPYVSASIIGQGKAEKGYALLQEWKTKLATKAGCKCGSH